jgi:diguanylate cyclase (GGDEF)-like protein
MRKWLFAVISIAIFVLWFSSFEIRPLSKVDPDDVFLEALELSGFLVLYFVVLKSFKNWKVDSAFFLIVLAYEMDIMDEFTKEPDFFGTTLQSLLIFFGLIGIGYEISKEMAWLKKKGYRDPLTGLLSRSYFEEWVRSPSVEVPYTVLVVDLDNLKRINDEFSHIAGDMALKTVASTLLECLRDEDFVFRYGGDEFVAVLPKITEETAPNTVERFMNDLKLKSKYLKFPLDVSYGFAEVSKNSSFKDVFEKADERMLKMKKEKKLTR